MSASLLPDFFRPHQPARWLAVALLLLTSGCASPHKHPSLDLISEREYYSRVAAATERSQVYNGFVNLLDVSATLLTNDVLAGQLDQRARIAHWSSEQYETEKLAQKDISDKSTRVMLTVFVQDRKQDDLHRASTTWRVFLDVGGRRYSGTATRMKNILAEVQTLYPHHTRFQTPYMVSFAVPTEKVSGGAKLTMTGPVASTTLELATDSKR